MTSPRIRTTRVRNVIAGAVLFATARAVHAQSFVYSYRGGDTARFAESVNIDISSRGRAGSVNMAFNRESRITLAFIRQDSVRAWYDALSINATGPSGKREIDGKPVLRLPFVLQMKPGGEVRTVASASLPESVRDLGQFNPSFDDFLQLLPLTPTPGAARTDTVVRRESDARGRKSLVHRVIRTKVERDTVLSGEPAIILSAQTTLRIERSAPIATGGFVAELQLAGTETTSAIVSRSGRLLHRQRVGELSGNLRYKNAGTDVSVPQQYKYRATLTAIRP